MRGSQRFAAVLLAGALSLPLAAAANAAASAAGSHAGHVAGTISPIWLSRLNLTPDEQTRVQAANDTYRADMEKARSLTDAEQRKEATRQARKSYRDALQAALTPDQQSQLKTMRAEAREYHALGSMGEQLAALNLTEAQKGKIQEIAARYQPDLEKLRASLKDAADKKAVHAQIRELQRKRDDEAKAVLTPEQIAQLQPAGAHLQAAK